MLESGVSPCEMIYLFVLLWQRYFRDSVQCCGQHLMSQLINHHYFFAIEQLRSILFESLSREFGSVARYTFGVQYMILARLTLHEPNDKLLQFTMQLLMLIKRILRCSLALL